MNARTLHPPRHPAASPAWLLGMLVLATLLALCPCRALAQHEDAEPTLLAALVPGQAPDLALPADEPAARPNLPGRLGLVLNRLGQRVLKLVPWHHAVAPAPVVAAAPLRVAEPEPDALPALPGDVPAAWDLKAAPDPLVALVHLSRPRLRLSGGAEISLRWVGGVAVTLKSQF